MIAIPTVDIREGGCVQLVGGSYDHELVRLTDPVGVARNWSQLGFTLIHVIDLDAATGRGSNADLVAEVIRDSGAMVQAGGGVRDADAIERLLDAGAARVVVGTRALEDPAWLEEVSNGFPDRLVVAADVRERRVVTRGWQRTLPRVVTDVIDSLNDLPLAGVLVTAVHREAQLTGADLHLVEDVIEESAHPVLAGGGIAAMHDLRNLAELGTAGVILGRALYTGALDARAAAEAFGG
ncbi:MAG TPA: 1-(5-phosphoribosyl)-5-[(5-phosphoribosylamino)methylideneamino] imidazole-4-carboxamide isomerase [Gemmatimonadaceae bacterium]|nr:1-(5-phosphoribosyl)-5-[(5-phosphoribosylamino)methylideneamino] imidazole-4-carboxamide isomerase [Gemmatimonadaceae bacterium]